MQPLLSQSLLALHRNCFLSVQNSTTKNYNFQNDNNAHRNNAAKMQPQSSEPKRYSNSLNTVSKYIYRCFGTGADFFYCQFWVVLGKGIVGCSLKRVCRSLISKHYCCAYSYNAQNRTSRTRVVVGSR